jgi:membrane protein
MERVDGQSRQNDYGYRGRRQDQTDLDQRHLRHQERHAFSDYVDACLPFGSGLLLTVANFLVSFILIAVLFAAIYKVLPDRPLAWRDVLIGAVGTTALFEVGKGLIALYIGSSTIASSYGAAGALIVILLWIYYTAQIFLLGAEFTKVYASLRGSKKSAVELRVHTPAHADGREDPGLAG